MAKALARDARPRLLTETRRVLKALGRVRRTGDPDAVHDLRVAIRRCRSIASILEEVDGHRAWRRLRRQVRPLFRTSGTLRDLHVREDWLKRLMPVGSPLRARLLSAAVDQQNAPRAALRRAVEDFDRARWRRLAKAVSRRVRLVPPNSPTARCLALERCEELRALHARAIQVTSPDRWHALRVALKRFRYAVEIVLPSRAAAWEASLAATQDALGDVHDLDELARWATAVSKGRARGNVLPLQRAIVVARDARLARYRRRASGRRGLLAIWRAGLLTGSTLDRVADARLRATALAMDSDRKRTASVVRLALQLLSAFRKSGVDSRLARARVRAILRASAELHRINVPGRRKSRHKAARDFLRQGPVPPGWTADDWRIAAEVVRYHRGPMPATRHRSFVRLPPKGQDDVRILAGLLRLARALDKCGAAPVRRSAVVRGTGLLGLHLRGLPVSPRVRVMLAQATRLFETSVGCPIRVVDAVGGQREVLRLSEASLRRAKTRAAM